MLHFPFPYLFDNLHANSIKYDLLLEHVQQYVYPWLVRIISSI